MKSKIFIILWILILGSARGYAADIEAILDEAAGASAFSFKDSGSVEQAHLDSDGNMVLKGCLRLDSSGTECTTAENLIVDGNVGIGTTSPANKLTINGITVADSLAQVVIGTGVTTNKGLVIQGVPSQGADPFEVQNGVGTVLTKVDSSGYITATGFRGSNFAFNGSSLLNFDGTNAYFSGAGNVGIGTTNPGAALDVKKASATVGIFDRLTNDGTIVSFQRDGAEQGNVTVAAGVVTLTAFTGSHYAWIDEAGGSVVPSQMGLLCTLTGHNHRLHNDPTSEIIYGITLSTKDNDSQILGSYLALQESTKPPSKDNPYLVMAVGNGDMWVTDTGEDIKMGDYLVSSKVSGHAQKDPGTYEVSYIVARAAEPVNWSKVEANSSKPKHKKISVFFEGFEKENVRQFKKDNEVIKSNEEIFKTEIRNLAKDNEALKKDNESFKQNNESFKREIEILKNDIQSLKRGQ